MKKIIIISGMLTILLIGVIIGICNKNNINNDKYFNLNNDRYIVNMHFVSSISTLYKYRDSKHYYEIDLKKNIINLREDFIDYKDDNNSYDRKLLNYKKLTQEESNKLRDFFSKVIEQNKKSNTEEYNDMTENNLYKPGTSLAGHYYYTIESKDAKNIVFDTAENIQEFEKIVKMDN